MMNKCFFCLAVVALLFQTALGQSNAVFRTSDELRVAVEKYFSNGTDEVIQMYGNMSDWKVGMVDDMSGLFQRYELFNDNISSWNTSNVKSFDRTFRGCASFNGSLTFWQTSKVTSMASTFQGASLFNSDISTWDTSKVENMGDMFRGASSFNADISFWNVEQLRDMSTMFWEATSFNIDLTQWKIQRVRDFTRAFLNATAFSQQLCWQLRENALVEGMFCGSQGGFRSDCICEHDLYYDEECVNPEVVALTSCDPPTESGAASLLHVKAGMMLGLVMFIYTLLPM